jgi:hypothetical protein
VFHTLTNLVKSFLKNEAPFLKSSSDSGDVSYSSEGPATAETQTTEHFCPVTLQQELEEQNFSTCFCH